MDIHAVAHVAEKQATATKGTYRTNNNGFSKELDSAKNKTTTLDAIFQKAADTYHVDVNLLRSMAKAESEFHNNSTSHSGAMGIMQLMPATAKYLGVKDAYDPEQNIMGGAKYISRLLKQYNGNVNLALAAYNAGSGNVRKYGGIPPFKETQNYIRKINNYMKKGVTIPKNLNVVANKSGTDYSGQTVSSAHETKAQATDTTSNTETTASATSTPSPATITKPDNDADHVAILSLTEQQSADLQRLQQELSSLTAADYVLSKVNGNATSSLLSLALDQVAVANLSGNDVIWDKLSEKESEEETEQIASQAIRYNKTVLGLLTDSDV